MPTVIEIETNEFKNVASELKLNYLSIPFQGKTESWQSPVIYIGIKENAKYAAFLSNLTREPCALIHPSEDNRIPDSYVEGWIGYYYRSVGQILPAYCSGGKSSKLKPMRIKIEILSEILELLEPNNGPKF